MRAGPMATGLISHTAMELLTALITTSVHTAAASGAETWWPMYMGCMRRFTSGITSVSSRRTTASSGCIPIGSGSLNRAASVALSNRVETGPSPFLDTAK